MSGLFFNNWMLLAGFLALAIPIAIHLLFKRRQRRLPFSTILFFVEQDERSNNRRRLRNLALLSLRLLLLALLVLAFARPYLTEPGNAATESPRRLAVLVLDQSASMGTADRWNRAMAEVRRTLNGLGPDDRVALVVCGARAEVVSSLIPPSRLKPMVRELRPGYGSARLADGLTEAASLLAGEGTERGTAAEILLISDLQAHSVGGLEGARLPRHVELRIADVAEPNTGNAGILGLSSAGGTHVEVHVRNFCRRETRPVSVWLETGEARSVHAFCQLPPDSETNLVVNVGGLSPGWHALRARLDGEDAFGADDTRHLAVYVPAPRLVWCIEPDASRPAFERKTFFIGSALAPETASGSFMVETIPAGEAGARLAAAAPDLLVLPGLRFTPPELPAAVSNHVARGGGLLMFLDDDVRPDRYNIDWSGLLPAVLRRAEGEPDRPETFWNLALPDTDGLLFAAFRAPHSGDVTRPVFQRRLGLTPLSWAATLAVFEDGEPLVVAGEIGEGTAVLVNTTANRDWNDWPKRRTFVPWIHGLAAAALGQAVWLSGTDHAVEFAQTLEMISTADAGATLQLLRPDGRAFAVEPDRLGKVSFTPAGAGVYTLQTPGGTAGLLAVNVPSEESSTRFVSPAGAREAVTWRETDGEGFIAGVAGMNQRELWPIILGFGLLVLLAESLLANRTWA